MTPIFSGGDIVIFVRAVAKLAKILKREAVDSFRRYASSYKSFAKLAARLNWFIEHKGLGHDKALRSAQNRIGTLLHEYFSKIDEFRDHLGPRRVKKSLRGALKKVRWTMHRGFLSELCEDLDRQIAHIELLIELQGGFTRRVAAEEPAQEPQPREYYAVIVTTPPVHRYGIISDSFCAVNDQPPEMPWTSTDTGLIPSLVASLVFRRHFALCLISRETWESPTKTLLQRFEGQLFWDYYGDASNFSRGSAWSSREILKINGVQRLGIVDSNAPELCTKRHGELRIGWDYLNIWWNDADFAIILASLLVGDTALRSCRLLVRQLSRMRTAEVVKPRGEICDKGLFAGAAVFGGAFVALCVTGGCALPICFASFGATWTGGVAVGNLQKIQKARKARRKDNCVSLEGRFPRLRLLLA